MKNSFARLSLQSAGVDEFAGGQLSQQVVARDEPKDCPFDRLACLFCRAAMSGTARPSFRWFPSFARERSSRIDKYAGVERDACLMPVRHR